MMKNRALVLLAGLALAPGPLDAQPRPSRSDAPGLCGLSEIGAVSETDDAREQAGFNLRLQAATAAHPAGTLIPVTRADGMAATFSAPQGGTALVAPAARRSRSPGWSSSAPQGTAALAAPSWYRPSARQPPASAPQGGAALAAPGSGRDEDVVMETSAPQAAAAAPTASTQGPAVCTRERTLRYGFFAYFEPVSFSADGDPQSSGYREHRGYEADLLTALETMADTGLSFDRIPIGEWPGIWLAPASPGFDMAGGGITIRDDRTRDTDGDRAVAFTSSHIRFRQSLLVRAEDADRLPTYDDLTRDAVVGAVAGTTGEERLLQLAGLADERGALAAGVRVVTPDGVVTADGSATFTVTAAASSPRLAGRTRLIPAAADMPSVTHLGEDEEAYVAALAAGEIDAFARGEIGNRDAAAASGGALLVTALDPAVEHAGFTVAADDEALRRCVNARVDYLTDGGAVGYREWAADPGVFAARAEAWNCGH